MAKKETMIEKIKRLMSRTDNIRNIGIVAHVDHGKTTASDSLLAGCGMLSMELAGKQLFTDFLKVEQDRGITVQSADVNMVHEYKGEEFLINLIDTPGHVDFGGDVTRAMRVIDGALVLIDAVEGAMPQTETVLRQALKERAKPVLFINKVDRLISEIKLTPEKMQEQLLKIISNVNSLIRDLSPEGEKDKWVVNVQEGSVCFGTALEKWALSFPYMKESKLTFGDVLKAYEQGEEGIKKLSEKAPLHSILLDMIVKHLPSPKVAQKYRIPQIWHGDLESDIGKSMLNCDPNGPLVLCVSKVTVDPQAGEIAIARIFSGTLKKGQDVFLIGNKLQTKIQQIYLFKGNQKFPVEEADVGNLIGVGGLKSVFSGETVASIEMDPFEEIKHIFEPVVTKAFEAKTPKDLPKLIETLKGISKEDPTIDVQINKETGQHLVSGLGELHLEIIENKVREERGLDISTSQPIVVYRETVTSNSQVFEGKSPNKHNKLFFKIEPLDDKIYEAVVKGDLPEARIRKKDKDLIEKFISYGIERKEAKGVRLIHLGNMFVESTRGVVHIGEIIEYIIQGLEELFKTGPLAKEPITRVKLTLTDCKLHEDAIHRGPAQIIPAVREALRNCFMTAKPTLLEPVQLRRIDAPVQFMGAISKLVQSRRGQMVDAQQEGNQTTIKAKIPVAESFGFTGDLRSGTEGRGVWFLVDSKFEKLPKSLEKDVIRKIRQRKGISLDAEIA
jgi:elongation factor 2